MVYDACMARRRIARSSASDDRDRQSEALEVMTLPASQLWAFKRAAQKNDLHNIAEGKYAQADMIWFTPEIAQRLKAVDSPL